MITCFIPFINLKLQAGMYYLFRGRPVVLKPMDIATTPSAVGGIYVELTTLRGAQLPVNEGWPFRQRLENSYLLFRLIPSLRYIPGWCRQP